MPRTELHNAAIRGNLAAVKSLLEAEVGVCVNIMDENGWSPLHLAAISGRPAMVKFLLEAGAGANLRDKGGWSPLHAAACNCVDASLESNQYASVIGLLLRAGAEVDSRNHDGKTPLMYTVSAGGLAAVQLLLEAGADPNLRDKEGRSALKHVDNSKPNSAAIILDLLLRVDSRDQVEVGLLSLQDNLRSMELKKKEVEDKVTCKICMAAEVAVVFAPCGHLCSCQSCAQDPLLVKCPICRGDVVSKDRIFMN